MVASGISTKTIGGIGILKFILKQGNDRKIKDALVCTWQVIQVKPQPPRLVAEFYGCNGSGYEYFLEEDTIPLVAGDYVEFLNEKYVDKNINEEWPVPDKRQHLEYHIKRALELLEDI